MPRRVLIAGCGYVGSQLARRLVGDGVRVWGLRRSAEVGIEGVETVRADLTDPRSLAELPVGLDAVVYTAAAGGRSDEAYRAAYVDGPRNLIDVLAAQEQPVRRVLFTSSTGVYGQSDGEWVDEGSPTEPASFTGRRLLEGERVFLDGPFPATVLRLAGIYGPGRTRLIDSVRRGEASCVEEPPEYTNRIHRDDCAGALRHLLELGLERPGELADLYLGVDDEPAERCEVLDFIARRLGAPEPRRVPADEAEGRRRGSGKRCRNDRLKATGYRFAFPTYRRGYAAMIDA